MVPAEDSGCTVLSEAHLKHTNAQAVMGQGGILVTEDIDSL